MKQLFWVCSVFLYLSACSQQANADIDVTEYQTTRSVKTERERELLQERFELERQLEISRQADEQVREQLRIEEEQGRQAARPWPVRLTEAKCSKCHTDQNYQRAAHTIPG